MKHLFKTAAGTVVIGLLAGALMGAAGTARAETITLRIASGHPPGVVYAGLMKNYFQPELEKRVAARTDHTIKFIEGYSGSIVKVTEVLEGVQNGIVEDPIGPSPLDPAGEGHRGLEAIAAFWDKQIAPNRILFNIVESYAAGSEIANVGAITITMPNGVVTIVNGVFTYSVNEAGKLLSLRAYWELPNMLVFAPPEA